MLPSGLLSTSGLLQAGGEIAGFAIGFFKTSSGSYGVIVEHCARVSERLWARHQNLVAVMADAIVGAVPYISVGDIIEPHMHAL